MDNKNNILLVLIVLVIGVAAILLGRSFFAGGGLSTAEVTTPSQTILPHGASLDFSKVENYAKSKRSFVYPQVTPIEVGLGLGQIVR